MTTTPHDFRSIELDSGEPTCDPTAITTAARDSWKAVCRRFVRELKPTYEEFTAEYFDKIAESRAEVSYQALTAMSLRAGLKEEATPGELLRCKLFPLDAGHSLYAFSSFWRSDVDGRGSFKF